MPKQTTVAEVASLLIQGKGVLSDADIQAGATALKDVFQSPNYHSQMAELERTCSADMGRPLAALISHALNHTCHDDGISSVWLIPVMFQNASGLPRVVDLAETLSSIPSLQATASLQRSVGIDYAAGVHGWAFIAPYLMDQETAKTLDLGIVSAFGANVRKYINGTSKRIPKLCAVNKSKTTSTQSGVYYLAAVSFHRGATQPTVPVATPDLVTRLTAWFKSCPQLAPAMDPTTRIGDVPHPFTQGYYAGRHAMLQQQVSDFLLMGTRDTGLPVHDLNVFLEYFEGENSAHLKASFMELVDEPSSAMIIEVHSDSEFDEMAHTSLLLKQGGIKHLLSDIPNADAIISNTVAMDRAANEAHPEFKLATLH